jgi:translation initiation factor 6
MINYIYLTHYLGIFRYDLYKSPNVGIFAKSNDSVVMLADGYGEKRSEIFVV